MNRPGKVHGQHRRLVGSACVIGVLSLPAFGAPVLLRLIVPGQTSVATASAVKVQVLRGQSNETQRVILLPAKVPGTLEVDLPEAGVWYVKAKAPGFWSETRVVVTPNAGEGVDLRLWPAATLRAESPAKPRLSDVTVRFQPIIDGSAQATFPAATSECRLDRRKIECDIPAGLTDYSLRSPGYVPIYRWNQTYAPGQIVNLGKLEFRKGSSLVGRVTSPPEEELKKERKVRVTLAPNTAVAPRPAEERRAQIASATVFADERGNFLFEGIRPGGYTLTATAPGLISETRAVDILDGLEAALREPLSLAPPATLDIALEPATDPWRKPWVIELLRIDLKKGHGVEVANSDVSPNGQWKRTDLPPGDYMITIRRQPQGTWHSQLITLSEDARLNVKIPIARLVGTLQLGGSPLAGSIWFGGEHGEISVPVTTNASGVFRAFLPEREGGVWNRVDVVAEEPKVRRTLRDVRLEGPDEAGISRVEINLPSNRLFGEVTTETGAPVSAATVFLSVPGEEGNLLQMGVDQNGVFSFNGLGEATYSVRAIGTGGKSDAVDLRVEKDTQEYVTLVLKKERDFPGVITSRHGPIAGARVSAYPDDRSGFDLVEWAVTDMEGKFTVPVRSGSRHLTLTVAAPGFAYQFLRVPFDSDRVLPLYVDQDGARLVIALNGPRLPYLFHRGGYLALEDLLGDGIATLNGQTLIAENLQSGHYDICMATSVEALAFVQSGRPGERCTGGFLPPAGQLTLAVPSDSKGH